MRRASRKTLVATLAMTMMAAICWGSPNDTRRHPSALQLQQVVRESGLEGLKPFFDATFYAQEAESWKYALSNGHLDFSRARIIDLDESTILMHVPTDDEPYRTVHDEAYFDFVYRIYEWADVTSDQPRIQSRAMSQWAPDFLRSRNALRVDHNRGELVVDNQTVLETDKPWMTIALEKTFQISNLTVNDQPVDYERLGYYVLIPLTHPGEHVLRVHGTVASCRGNNQFFSIEQTGFFVRAGGFAVIPAPPPDNRARYVFPQDRTEFSIDLDYPSSFSLLHYGRDKETTIHGDRSHVRIELDDVWNDGIGIYAQEDWQPRFVRQGDTTIGFYFPSSEREECEFLISETRTLLDWLNQRFRASAVFEINFVVLDRFYEGGLLNDGHSVVAQNAGIIGREGIGYLHEVCHAAPQPAVDGRFLWINEGFTNFLAFDFLDRETKGHPWWERNKRIYTHAFSLRNEPLIRLTNYRIPTVWWAYMKGPWVFRMLESIMGSDQFDRALRNLGQLSKKQLSIDDYKRVFSVVHGESLDWFFSQWLELKNHPVLDVHGQFEGAGEQRSFVVLVRQIGDIFRMPLDVELSGRHRTLRHRLWLDQETNSFRIPAPADVDQVRYDPDHLLFAVVKSGGCTPCVQTQGVDAFWVDGEHRFRGDDDEMVFRVRTFQEVSVWDLSQGGDEFELRLDKSGCPTAFSKNGKRVFSQNVASGVLDLGESTEHVAEPVYPSVFAPFLLAAHDWNQQEKQSFLVVDDEHESNLVSAIGKPAAGDMHWMIHEDEHGTLAVTVRGHKVTEITDATGTTYERTEIQR